MSTYVCGHKVTEGLIECPKGCINTTIDGGPLPDGDPKEIIASVPQQSESYNITDLIQSRAEDIPPADEVQMFTPRQVNNLIQPRLDEIDKQLSDMNERLDGIPLIIKEAANKYIHKVHTEKVEARRKWLKAMFPLILISMKKYFPYPLVVGITAGLYEAGIL